MGDLDPAEGGLDPDGGGLDLAEGGLDPAGGGLDPVEGGLDPATTQTRLSTKPSKEIFMLLSAIEIYCLVSDFKDLFHSCDPVLLNMNL